jgi:hypothetical protein
MTQEGNVIYAQQGYVFKRKGTDEVLGDTVYLGKSYYINGVLLDEPHQDTPEDFEEVIPIATEDEANEQY